MREINLGSRMINSKSKPYFIADIGANHDGDINRAFELIELAKEAGADCAKFQNFKAPKIVSKEGFNSLGSQLSHQSKWKKSVFEVYKDASISESWTQLLKDKCDEVGIDYMTSPYDFDSVDLVEPYLHAYKIGSGDITWLEIIEYIAKKGKPVLLATGASTIDDVKRAVNEIYKYNDNLVLMQCNTNYTGDIENFKYVNLNVLKKYKELYPNAILGLSDHTPGHSAVLGAIALGAVVLEKHLTDDNNRVGPDHKFAMNPKTWREMVDRSLELYYALGSSEKVIQENEQQTIVVQRRGIYIKKDIKEGEIFTKDILEALRPCKPDGIEPYKIDTVIGKKAKVDIKKNAHLREDDLE